MVHKAKIRVSANVVSAVLSIVVREVEELEVIVDGPSGAKTAPDGERGFASPPAPRASPPPLLPRGGNGAAAA